MLVVKAIFSTALILFSVIDIIGSLPIIIDLKKKGVRFQPGIATLAAGGLMIAFLFFGGSILSLFHVEVSSFALAGSLIIFLIGLEMTLGQRIFRDFEDQNASGTIVPLVFPLMAGAGTLTTILSLKASFEPIEIIGGILLNLIFVFIVLKSTGWIEKKMSDSTASNLRKIFGIILLAIAIQMFRSNL